MCGAASGLSHTCSQAPPQHCCAAAEADFDAAGESFKAAYRQSARMPEGLGEGVAIDGMQQFAAAVSSHHCGQLQRIPDLRVLPQFQHVLS